MGAPNKPKIIAWTLAFGLVGIVLGYLGSLDSHRTNFRYLKWKYGLAPQDYKWSLHLIMVDPSLRDSMRGKPMDQLRSWFPESGPATPKSMQSEWLSAYKPEPSVTFEVVGNMHFAVRLRDGKFDDIFPMKG